MFFFAFLLSATLRSDIITMYRYRYYILKNDISHFCTKEEEPRMNAKKTISLILALLMLVSMFPASAIAAEDAVILSEGKWYNEFGQS